MSLFLDQLALDNITTAARDLLVLPAKGTIIFNVTNNQWEGNTGTAAAPIWTPIPSGSNTNLGTFIDPPTFTGDVDNYSPAGLEPGVVLRLNPGTSDRDISGIDSTGFSNGDKLYITNISTTKKLKLLDDDGGSLSANRLRFKGDETIEKSMGITLFYDALENKFKTISISH